MAVTLKHLSKADTERVARKVEAEIRRRGTVERRNEWEVDQALSQLNVFLSELVVADAPFALHFSPQEIGTMVPVILSASRNEPERCRQIAHELAHELMRDWVAPELYDTDTVICTEQDNTAARERIARRVQKAFRQEPDEKPGA